MVFWIVATFHACLLTFFFSRKNKKWSNIKLNLNKVSDFLSNFKEIWTVSRNFNKILQYQISRKSVQWEPSFFHEDKRGWWVDETKLKGAFRDYANGLERSKILFTLWTLFSSKKRVLTHATYGMFSFPGLACLEIPARQAYLNLQCVRKMAVSARGHTVLVSVGCIRCVGYIGNFLPTFRDNLSVPSLRVKNGFLTIEGGTDSLFRNVGSP